MITLRPSGERGHIDHGWLNTYHSFSFGDYYDPQWMGWRSLRVINEDYVAPGAGFPMHGHREMEIVTYIASGTLEHKDSLGSGGQIRPGELQRMSAGTGIMHSEFNPSAGEPVHLLQIWILPGRRGVTPGYEQRSFADNERRDALRLLASPDGRFDSLTIVQDAYIYGSLLGAGQRLSHALAPGRGAWLQLVRGTVSLSDGGARVELVAGDGAAVEDSTQLEIVAEEEAELLVFDLA
jgi:quercetin 2,3-dioxygenase